MGDMIIDNQNKILIGAYDSEQEKWKLIHEINNLYAISTLGKVMSMRDGRIMKTVIRSGYENVILTDTDGQQRGFLVHRLLATAFISNPNDYPVVNHKDENPLNNTIDNLEWCTQRYNCVYNNVHLKRGEKLKGKSSWNKGKTILNKRVKMINLKDNVVIVFDSISKAATYIQHTYNRPFASAYQCIYRVAKGQRKTYLKFKWEFID